MNRKRGLKVLTEMLGQEGSVEVRQGWKTVHPDFEKYVVGFVAGEVWARPGLDRKTRSLCTIAALAALGRTLALDLNIRMARKNGATKQEILETLLQVAPYAGFPAAWEGLAVARRVMNGKHR